MKTDQPVRFVGSYTKVSDSYILPQIALARRPDRTRGPCCLPFYGTCVWGRSIGSVHRSTYVYGRSRTDTPMHAYMRDDSYDSDDILEPTYPPTAAAAQQLLATRTTAPPGPAPDCVSTADSDTADTPDCAACADTTANQPIDGIFL
jgi:hypothetical protein